MPRPYIRVNIRVNRTCTADAIADSIAEDYADGRLPAESRLPPVRVLAHQLGVSKNTVQAAYEELVSRDIVEPRGRSGVFVKSSTMLTFSSCASPNPHFRPTAPNHEPPEAVMNLSSVFIDSSLLPVKQLEQCYRLAFEGLGFEVQAKADYQGCLPLRAAIAKRLNDRGFALHAENVITTVGSQHALDLVCRVLKVKRLATEDPCYLGGKRLFELNDVEVIGLPVNPFAWQDIGRWETILKEQRPELLYLTTNFQNPTGYSYSTSELERIVKLSSDLGIPVLEDDWGSDMLSHSEYRPPLRALAGANVLYLNSFSKKVLPTLRVGYLAAPESLIKRLVEAKRASIIATPALPEMALATFLQRGYYDSHLKKMQAELDRRYSACLKVLEAVMGPGCRWTLPGGGPLIWLEIPPSVCLDALADRMRQRGYDIDVRVQRMLGATRLHGVPIGFADPKSKALEQGLGTLAAEIQALVDCPKQKS
jgi:DNA-binding transcriptional MocR family regulator